MATTDQRAGFRLPWTSDQRPTADETDTTAPVDSDTDGDVAVGAAGHEAAQAHREGSTDGGTTTGQAGTWGSTETAGTDAVDHHPTETETVSAETAIAPNATSPGKKPSKYLADLTKAMQATAESARSQTLGQAQADAKSHIEDIHSRSASEASELRKRADDDVAGIREWSKAEIARVRDETERRIAGRKGELEGQLEVHAGAIEREIERVQGQLSTFEAEMIRFYDHLLSEEDPTRFASLFESLPEPPLFTVSTVDLDEIMAGTVAVAASVEAAEPERAEATLVADTAEAVAAPDVDESEPLIGATSAEDRNGYPPQTDADRETAMVAIQAAFEAAAQAEADAGRAEAAADRAESVAESLADGEAPMVEAEATPTEGEAEGASGDAEVAEAEAHPQAESTGLTDLDAAEAEAEAAASASSEEIPTLDDDALAARLDGLVPEHRTAPEPVAASNANEMQTTQVVVVGLVSVASIASFKRHLGRISGVRSVGVSSGPDGEFVFSATHGQNVVLRDVIPTLQGFQARVTNTGDGIINVTAHDPESEG
jgi:hypothetical protein